MKPGNKFVRVNKGSRVTELVILLSSDREPGIEWTEDFCRCAQFQISSDGNSLFGAQIVLYTKGELEEMLQAGSLELPLCVKV